MLKLRVYTVPFTARIYSCKRQLFSFNGPSEQSYSIKKTLPYPAKHVYDIVADIDSYESFIPYCTGSKVTTRDEKTNSPLFADLCVGWENFNETFESQLVCKPYEKVTATASNHPLFKTLLTEWSVEPVENNDKKSNVVLNLKFEFTDPLYNMVSSVFAPKVSNIMIDAFTKRIIETYRKKRLVELQENSSL